MVTILHHNRRAFCFLLIIIILSMSLCGCDMYSGKRPCNYPNTTWICDAPEIVLTVDSDGMMSASFRSVTLPQGSFVDFDFGNQLIVHNNTDGTDLFVCRCSFSEKQFVAKVVEDQLFGGSYLGKALTFQRQSGDG